MLRDNLFSFYLSHTASSLTCKIMYCCVSKQSFPGAQGNSEFPLNCIGEKIYNIQVLNESRLGKGCACGVYVSKASVSEVVEYRNNEFQFLCQSKSQVIPNNRSKAMWVLLKLNTYYNLMLQFRVFPLGPVATTHPLSNREAEGKWLPPGSFSGQRSQFILFQPLTPVSQCGSQTWHWNPGGGGPLETDALPLW